MDYSIHCEGRGTAGGTIMNKRLKNGAYIIYVRNSYADRIVLTLTSVKLCGMEVIMFFGGFFGFIMSENHCA